MPNPPELDLRGLKCPMPVLRTRRALDQMTSGSTLKVITSDPLAVIDIPHFVGTEGHTLAGQAVDGDQATFEIIKRL